MKLPDSLLGKMTVAAGIAVAGVMLGSASQALSTEAETTPNEGDESETPTPSPHPTVPYDDFYCPPCGMG